MGGQRGRRDDGVLRGTRGLRLAALLVGVALLVLAACDTTLVPSETPAAATDALTPSSAELAPSMQPGTTVAPTSPPTASAGPRGRAGLPDPRLTPGATNPDVTQANLGSTACRTGWSKSVRPPVSYTGTLKRRQIVEYGYADRDASHYQEDHLIPLSLGGAPSDPRNLWPEPLSALLPDGTEVGAPTKDGFELYLHEAVCAGRVSLAAAQREMATDWVAAWEAAGRP